MRGGNKIVLTQTDEILWNGALPLGILDQRIDNWIAAEQAK